MTNAGFGSWTLCTMLAMVANWGVAGAAEVPNGTIPADITADVPADPMTLIPADQRHLFVAVDPKWTKVTTWLEPKGGAFIESAKDPQVAGARRMERYFEGTDTSSSDGYRKLIEYSADGKIVAEAENFDGKYWSRDLWPDGSLAAYEYRSSRMHMDSGVAVRRDGKLASSFTGGRGTRLQWHTSDAQMEQLVIRDGVGLLTAIYDGSTVALQFGVDNNMLVRDGTHEMLTLSGRSEAWELKGQTVTGIHMTWVGDAGDKAPKTLPADEIHMRFVASTEIGSRWGADGLTRKDYDARRAEFIATYSAFLKTHGETWESLHLEKVRDDPAGELPKADPAWFEADKR